jgi:hypothetical protein
MRVVLGPVQGCPEPPAFHSRNINYRSSVNERHRYHPATWSPRTHTSTITTSLWYIMHAIILYA